MIATSPSAQSIPPTSVAKMPGRVLARLLLLGQEDLVAGGAQGCGHLGVPGALGGREQRTGEIELHRGSIAERDPAPPRGRDDLHRGLPAIELAGMGVGDPLEEVVRSTDAVDVEHGVRPLAHQRPLARVGG